MDNEGQTSEAPIGDVTNTSDEEVLEPLSGNPCFDVLITNFAISPHFTMVVPKAGRDILPSHNCDASLSRGRKYWQVTYYGKAKQRRFDTAGWTQFDVDNRLKVGDCCVFELMEATETSITLKVRVLCGDFPEALKGNGSQEKPLLLD